MASCGASGRGEKGRPLPWARRDAECFGGPGLAQSGVGKVLSLGECLARTSKVWTNFGIMSARS